MSAFNHRLFDAQLQHTAQLAEEAAHASEQASLAGQQHHALVMAWLDTPGTLKPAVIEHSAAVAEHLWATAREARRALRAAQISTVLP